MNTDNLRLSVRNLIAQFGRTDSLVFGTIVNVGLAAPGIYLGTTQTGWLMWLGWAWAFLHIVAIVRAWTGSERGES